MIPRLQPITVTPRPLNERLWLLAEKEADGTISSLELIELNCLCLSLETEQDNGETE